MLHLSRLQAAPCSRRLLLQISRVWLTQIRYPLQNPAIRGQNSAPKTLSLHPCPDYYTLTADLRAKKTQNPPDSASTKYRSQSPS